MIDDLDIWRAAKLLIDQHGTEAATYAAGRADLLLEKGSRWRRRCVAGDRQGALPSGRAAVRA
jgi:hypothetical protein